MDRQPSVRRWSPPASSGGPKKFKSDGLNLPPDNCVGPNCGVTCVSLAAGVTFKEAWSTLIDIKFSKKPRKSPWRGGTTHDDRVEALKRFNVKFTELTLDKGCTLKTFIEKKATEGKLYMVTTTRHVQMVKDKAVSDQAGPRLYTISGWRLRKRVKKVLLIDR